MTAAIIAALLSGGWWVGIVNGGPVGLSATILGVVLVIRASKFAIRADTLSHGLIKAKSVTLSALTSAAMTPGARNSAIRLTDATGQRLDVNLLGMYPPLGERAIQHIEQASAHAPLSKDDREFFMAYLEASRNTGKSSGLWLAGVIALPLLLAAPTIASAGNPMTALRVAGADRAVAESLKTGTASCGGVTPPTHIPVATPAHQHFYLAQAQMALRNQAPPGSTPRDGWWTPEATHLWGPGLRKVALDNGLATGKNGTPAGTYLWSTQAGRGLPGNVELRILPFETVEGAQRFTTAHIAHLCGGRWDLDASAPEAETARRALVETTVLGDTDPEDVKKIAVFTARRDDDEDLRVHVLYGKSVIVYIQALTDGQRTSERMALAGAVVKNLLAMPPD